MWADAYRALRWGLASSKHSRTSRCYRVPVAWCPRGVHAGLTCSPLHLDHKLLRHRNLCSAPAPVPVNVFRDKGRIALLFTDQEPGHPWLQRNTAAWCQAWAAVSLSGHSRWPGSLCPCDSLKQQQLPRPSHGPHNPATEPAQTLTWPQPRIRPGSLRTGHTVDRRARWARFCWFGCLMKGEERLPWPGMPPHLWPLPTLPGWPHTPHLHPSPHMKSSHFVSLNSASYGVNLLFWPPPLPAHVGVTGTYQPDWTPCRQEPSSQAGRPLPSAQHLLPRLARSRLASALALFIWTLVWNKLPLPPLLPACPETFPAAEVMVPKCWQSTKENYRMAVWSLPGHGEAGFQIFLLSVCFTLSVFSVKTMRSFSSLKTF